MRKTLFIALLTALLVSPFAPAAAQGCTYTVQPGDTVIGIASQFGLQPWELQELNQEQYPIWETLGVGWVLIVPCDGGGAPPPPSDDPTGALTATPRVNMNVRGGPSTTYPIIGSAAFGVPLPLEARNSAGNWVLFNDGARRGWVAAWLTNLSGDVFALPVSTEIIGQPPSGGSPGPGPSTGFNLGGQTQTLGHPGLMRSAGMTWVKFQYKWSPGSDPQEIAGMVNAAHSQGFRVLLSIPGPLYPSSIDFAAYTQFLQGVAGYGPDAIEVWNEMNLNREWPTGQINPTSYVNNMLAPGYRAIKAVNPNILVISGAPAPTGFHDGVTAWSDDRYIAGMAAAGAANYMDCIGVHYNAGATSPDQSFGHPADPGVGHYSWYFWPTYNLYAGTFPGKPVCFTEIGYVSGDGYPPLPSNFAWGGGTSTAEHAQWLGRAAQLARSTGRVRLFIVFNVDFTFYGADDPQAGYAILRPDGSCPACGLLAAAGQ